MNTKHISVLAALTLSIQVIQPMTPSYTKDNLRTIEKTAALVNTLDNVCKLFDGNLRLPENVRPLVNETQFFTAAALEDANAVNTIQRLTAALASTGPITGLTTSGNAKNVAVKLLSTIVQEIAQLTLTNRIQRQLTGTNQRLNRRALYIAKDIVINGLASIIEEIAHNQLNGGREQLGKVITASFCSTINQSLLRQIMGEIIISNAQDDAPVQAILDANAYINQTTQNLTDEANALVDQASNALSDDSATLGKKRR